MEFARLLIITLWCTLNTSQNNTRPLKHFGLLAHTRQLMVANKEFAYQWKSLWLGKHNNYFFRFKIVFSNSFTDIIHKLNSIIHLSYQELQTFYCCHLILICLLYALFFRSLFRIIPISYSHMLLPLRLAEK